MSNETKTTFFASNLLCVRDLLFGIVPFGNVNGEVGLGHYWVVIFAV